MKLAAWVLLAACGGGKPPASAAPRVANALVAAIASAEQRHAPWRCVAEDLPEPAAGPVGKGWELAGRTLRRTDKPGERPARSGAAGGAEVNDKPGERPARSGAAGGAEVNDKELVIGVVADAGGADSRTVAALGRLRAKLDEANADLVLALGGMGTTEPELEATLGVLAKPGSPVVALPGDLESVAAETAAIAAINAKGAPVVDGRLVRWIELPEATIGTIAGAGSPLRLVADGCAWQAEDVLQLYVQLAARHGLRIAATAESPRDHHAGEAALVPGPAIDLVIHGPTQPAPSPAQAGGRDGAKTLLSPGTADATPRLPETRAPAAGLLVIHGASWSWKPLVDRP